MNYVNNEYLRTLRESRCLTQKELARLIGVSDKAVSKWETGRGLPDISLVEPLAKGLGISVSELFAGKKMTNRNKSSNVMRSRFYVCPVCGNVIHCMGEAVLSCCGVTLPPLEAEEMDAEHKVRIEFVDDGYYVLLSHPMTREHHISFMAMVNLDRMQLVKLYPEQDAAARFARYGSETLYLYCQKDGLYAMKLS